MLFGAMTLHFRFLDGEIVDVEEAEGPRGGHVDMLGDEGRHFEIAKLFVKLAARLVEFATFHEEVFCRVTTLPTQRTSMIVGWRYLSKSQRGKIVYKIKENLRQRSGDSH